jgi:hypothetical protein
LNNDLKNTKRKPHPIHWEWKCHTLWGFTFTTAIIKNTLTLWRESPSTLGHQPARVKPSNKDQLDKYSHVMVYGEYSQSPAVEYCKLLASPTQTLDKTYL